MDNIVKIAIIVGMIIIGVTGIFVYIKIKKIDEGDNYDEIEIDDKDTIKLDSLNDNSNLAKESTLNNDSKVINNFNDKFIDNIEKEEKVIPEVKMPVFQTKEVVKEEVSNKVDIEPKVENKIENRVENKQVSNVNAPSSSKPYSNKYSSTSTLISPVGYYSNELVRNDLMGKRASKVEKPIVSDDDGTKFIPNTIEIISEVKEPVVEVKKEVKEEVMKSEIKNNKISFADMKQTYVKKEDKPKNFMEEVSEKLSRELKPQTIELTDYEQKQEDEAIISYQELLANKDKTFNISDEEEDEDFISALKSFRDSL